MRPARACCSTSTTRSACSRSTSERSTSTSPWAAATSTCAAAPARASSTLHLGISMRRLPRSTSAGSPRSRRSPTRGRIRRATPPAATRGWNRRRRCCRSTRRAPGRCSRRRSAWRGCASTRSQLQRRLVALLAGHGIVARGRRPRTAARSSSSATATPGRGRRRSMRAGSSTDARGEWLRLCPDVLTTDAELEAAATALAEIAKGRQSLR